MSNINKDSIAFLKDLRDNNNREWFNTNKKRYQAAHENVVAFADALIEAMNTVDEIETISGKKSMFRIYRDVRFSKDKTPYNHHFSGGLSRATKMRRGSYYFRFEPEDSYLVGGFWGPNSDDMKRLRQEFAEDTDTFRKIINDKTVVDTFGGLHGEQVKTAPKGYSKDHPAIDLLRYKQFMLMHKFSSKEVSKKDFLDKAVDTFKKMRPFLDYMTDVLTTDANEEPLY